VQLREEESHFPLLAKYKACLTHLRQEERNINENKMLRFRR